MERNRCDVIVIGGGQAGIPLAQDLAAAGKRIILVERKYLGGSCVNFGCTPTKAAIASAHTAHMARRGGEFGILIPKVDVNFRAVIERAQKIALTSRTYLDHSFETTENPRLLRGHGKLDGREDGSFRVRVGEHVISADQVVVNTGTRSVIPPIEGLKDIKFIHAGNWLESAELPDHLAMIGGGAIGLEMAQFYRRMGSRVTVIEFGAQIAGHEDPDIAQALQTILESEGIEFRLRTSVKRIRSDGRGLTLALGEDGSSQLGVSHVFVATGRLPNTDDLGLETVGVTMSNHGIIQVDERLTSNVKGIWVAGDVRGGPQFTHTSWDDYRILLSQIAGDGSRTMKRVVPYATFTDPELGRVGMTEQEARRAGHSVKIGRFEMSDSGKAFEIGETAGVIKVVIDTASNLILGAAVLAANGAELVHIYITLMNAGAPYTVIREAIHIHPTLAEAIQSAVSDIA
jgi:pyruvate/2-oxoglutarate dehydrogenase complex dihydrolipoamide dehydrogenase (E3) component